MKGVGIIGNYRGKLGNTVAYVIKDGKTKETQAFRVYQPSVKNPRSAGQMLQRMKIATVAKAYTVGKSILDHSWEGESEGKASFDLFRRLALRSLNAAPAAFGYVDYQSVLSQAGPYQVSQGSLPTFGLQPDAVSIVSVSLATTNAPTGSDVTTTAQELADALGIPVGGYITVVAWLHDDADQGRFNWTWLRMYYPSDGSIVVDSAQAIKDAFAVRVYKTGANGLDVAPDGTSVLPIVLNGGETVIDAACVIRSTSADRRRSTEYMAVRAGADLRSLNAALATYPQGEALILNGGNDGVSTATELPTEFTFNLIVNGASAPGVGVLRYIFEEGSTEWSYGGMASGDDFPFQLFTNIPVADVTRYKSLPITISKPNGASFTIDPAVGGGLTVVDGLVAIAMENYSLPVDLNAATQLAVKVALA